MKPLKRLLRRPIRRYLEDAVATLIERNPELKVVAVVGSVGKTSTKLATATVLGEGRRVLANHTNYNSEFGLPLAVFELYAPDSITDIGAWLTILRTVRSRLQQPFPYDALVLELGTDAPGDLAGFARYLTPDIAVVTAITPEHMAFFKTLEAVGDEEFSIALAAKRVVVHKDDAEIMRRAHELGHRQGLTYGVTGDVHWGSETKLCLGTLKHDTIVVSPQVYGDHSRLALLAAAAIALELGLSHDEIKRGVNAVAPVPGRMQRLEGINGTVLIDDTYNSSPDAATAALKTLLDGPTTGRKIALLGQMNELGEYSQKAHQMVGRAAAKVDLLVTLSGDANTILGPAAVTAGLLSDKLHRFDSPYAAGAWLRDTVITGDTILFKGSQNGVFAEEAIKPFLKHPSDQEKLVRQSASWLAKKRAQFDDAPR